MNEDSRKRLIETLGNTPGRLAGLLEQAVGADLTRRPAPDEFSIRENVHHLHDIETEGFARRLERLLTEDAPTLPGIDGSRLAVERRYNETPHDAALREFTRVRGECVVRLRGLSPADWDRSGMLGSAGRVSVEKLVENCCEHDADHLGQIERIVSGTAARQS